MAKRLLDLVLATLALVAVGPLLLLGAVGIVVSSPGPVLYRARRVGRGGRPFLMYKLRTMHVGPDGGVPITAPRDPRVFAFGALLRAAKIDELPQLLNVLRGEMSLVGPRPEDPDVVRAHYAPQYHETLAVRPGMASPGSIYQFTHGDALLDDRDPMQAYVDRLLPLKLALDLVYVRRQSLVYDLALIARTLRVIAARVAGRRSFRAPPELRDAAALIPPRPSVAAIILATLLLAGLGACKDDAAAVPLVRPPLDSGAALLVGAGDIASCGGSFDEATAALLDSLPGTVFTTGDNVYDDGTAAEFATCYEPSWGRHRARTRPAPGNHDYGTPGAAGYFRYFGAAAGDSARGYYSYTVGEWLVLSLNSEVDASDSSAQLRWVRAQLASHPGRCAAAYWHRPRFSSGTSHGPDPAMGALWTALYQAGADIVLSGHEHHYERFAPQTPAGAADPQNGIRQFVVGTGGSTRYGFGTPAANSEVRHTGTPGVLALGLGPERYSWQFIPAAGHTFTDSGSGTCHDAPARRGTQ